MSAYQTGTCYLERPGAVLKFKNKFIHCSASNRDSCLRKEEMQVTHFTLKYCHLSIYIERVASWTWDRHASVYTGRVAYWTWDRHASELDGYSLRFEI